jgi:hypothetical protein
MSTTQTTPQPTTTVDFEKNYKYYDADLVLQTKVVKGTFTPAVSVQNALDRIASDEKVLRALNGALQRVEFSRARKDAASGGISKKIVLKVIAPLRLLPGFAEMVAIEAKGEARKISRAKQTESLLAMLKMNPALMAAIANASSMDEDDEEEDDTEENS